LNNWTEEDCKDIETWIDRGVEGIGYGKEIGENKTPHLQGFIVMKKKCGLKTVKELNKRMHLERMKGRITQSIAYCSKQSDLVKFGKWVRAESFFLIWLLDGEILRECPDPHIPAPLRGHPASRGPHRDVLSGHVPLIVGLIVCVYR